MSIWDTFCRKPGSGPRNGDTGDVACDQYHRFEDDIALMAQLGIGAYRFSMAWPRILPEGGGAVNQQGLDHYRRVVESLNRHGITLVATLYHWDLPQALEDLGGWANRDTAYLFAEYAAIVHGALADEVPSGSRSTSPGSPRGSGTGPASTRPGRRTTRSRSPPPITCCSRTDWRWRRWTARRGRDHVQPPADDARLGRRGRRPGRSAGGPPHERATTSTRSSAAATRTSWSSSTGRSPTWRSFAPVTWR